MLLRLWFDVGIKRYTTKPLRPAPIRQLWFDVEIKRYTTHTLLGGLGKELWFDVGIKRYTTYFSVLTERKGCGLM